MPHSWLTTNTIFYSETHLSRENKKTFENKTLTTHFRITIHYMQREKTPALFFSYLVPDVNETKISCFGLFVWDVTLLSVEHFLQIKDFETGKKEFVF